MTKEQTKAAIAVMQAYVDGAEIQFRSRESGCWFDVQSNGRALEWQWLSYDYRIKPKPREWWVLVDENDRVVEGAELGNLVSATARILRRVKVREILET